MTTMNSPNDTKYDEKEERMTRARRIGRYLSRYNWYFPILNQNAHDELGQLIPPPNLDSAWAHFEHIGLPRCFPIRENHRLLRAEPGEKEDETILYPLLKTNVDDLGAFGTGVGLYFNTLRQLAVVMFIAGLINIPAMAYLNSDGHASAEDRHSLPALLKVSSVCTDSTWQPCPTCSQEDWDLWPATTRNRFAVGEASDGSELTFIRVNNCKMDTIFWLFSYISMFFVVLSIYAMDYLQKKNAVTLDEKVQTATDYSIVIKNPPKVANDPIVWKEFLEKNFEAKVEVVTVTINNETLVRKLIQRRKFLIALENMLPLGTKLDVDELDKMADHSVYVSIWNKLFCCAKTPEQIVQQIHNIDKKIVELTEKKYHVSEVFVTFDTEASQRNVLEDLCVATFKYDSIPQDKRYEGNVLWVMEPDEPKSIRWTDLSDPPLYQYGLQIFTGILSLALIAAAAACIAVANFNRVSQIWLSVIIILMNTIVPIVVNLICSFESHDNESYKSASQYYKITAFRWLVTVIIPLGCIPFANILNKDEIIAYVETLFIAEVTSRPVLQIFNIIGILQRHILGPRAIDQRRMNLQFGGDYFALGDRYTDVTKILFLTSFYAILYPLGFFFASGIFVMYFCMDKFCLLRSWKQGPMIGVNVSELSMFFFKICVLTYAFMAAFLGSQMPYDNACVSTDPDLSKYTSGGAIVQLPLETGNPVITIDVTTNLGYEFCNEEVIREGIFPPSRGRWMNTPQNDFSQIFGWTAVVVLSIVLLSVAKYLYEIVIYPCFFLTYEPHGEDQEISFQSVTKISGYVPQVQVRGFSFPFLICDDANVKHGLIGWTDPEDKDNYDSHNLMKDVTGILNRKEGKKGSDHQGGYPSSVKDVFSIARSFVREDGNRMSSTESDPNNL